MSYFIFTVMQEIRGLEPLPLAEKLVEVLCREEGDPFAPLDDFAMHSRNSWCVHHMLARITDFLGRKSGGPRRYLEDIDWRAKNRFEVEHIWADRPERHTEEFPNEYDFRNYRNRVGGLLLLPKQFNASYNDAAYEDKLPHYFGQNILAKSLHRKCYEKSPGFLRFMEEAGLPFEPYDHFGKAELDKRQQLYKAIAGLIWRPENLLREAEA